MLEGNLEIKLGAESMMLAEGAFSLVPTGVLHGFGNPGGQPTRFLVIMSPGGLEGYFDELPALVEKDGYPPPPDLMGELMKRHDMVMPG